MPAFARLRALAPVLILGACAHPLPVAEPVRPYVPPPATTATARLVMRNKIDKADTYEVVVFDDVDKCTGRSRVGAGTPTSNPESTTVAAARWQTVETLVHQPDRMMCRMRWSFVPAPGRSYLVYATSRPDGCMTTIFDMTNPDALKVEPSSRRREISNNACLPLAQAKPVKLGAPKDSGDASDLPTSSETPEAPTAKPPSAAPVAKAPTSKPAAGVGVDDLQGLIGGH